MIIPDGYGQVNLFFTGAALPTGAQVTWGFFRQDVAMSPVEVAQEVLLAVQTSTILGGLSTGVALTKTLVKFGPNDDGPFGEVSSNLGGSIAQEQGYAGVSILVKKATAFGGRSGSGRMYWPGIPEVSVANGGLLDPAKVNSLQVDMTALWQELETREIPMWLLHGAPGRPPYHVTSLTVQSMVATQRRRQRR